MKRLLLILNIGFTSCFAVKFLQCGANRNYSYFIMSVRESHFKCRLSDFSDFKLSPCKLENLPIEENRDNYVRRNVKNALFSYVDPTPVLNPNLVSFSGNVLNTILNLDASVVKNKDFINFVSGNKVIDSSNPIAHRYGGHQFGVWAMQLGDGRAILLGEFINSEGQRWELQLKGSGRTPYSRDGDGRAVLRSSIREFLCSEFMFFLGVPTSRAATIVLGENMVMRDMFYNGNPKLENTAVVLRLAPSWFRIGSLELPARNHENELLEQLINFLIEVHFPDLDGQDNKLLSLFTHISRMCSDLAVAWQSVGFTHGVLNTDNISLLGVTIDYGPFGFLEEYSLLYTPNHSDSERMYCYGRQPQIMLFNLMNFLKSLAPLMSKTEIDQATKWLQAEHLYINSSLESVFSEKLGFEDSVKDLVVKLMDMLGDTKADFTMTFRELSETPLDKLTKPTDDLWALSKLSTCKEYSDFIHMYTDKLKEKGISDEVRMTKMMGKNPRYVPRNWMLQSAISLAEKGDYSEVNLLLQVGEKPFIKQDKAEEKGYASKPPSWAKNVINSCSS